MRGRSPHAFTLIEILSAIAIIAVMLAVALPFIGNYVATARRTADEQTLATLNDALTRYKTSGGSINALTFGAPIGNVLNTLKQPLNWAGMTHQVLGSAFTVPAQSLQADGSRKTYRFVRFGTYMAPNTVLSGDSSGVGGILPEGVASLTHASGVFSLNITSSTGFVAYRVDGGDARIVPSGGFVTASGNFMTFWSCSGGNAALIGNITTMTASGNALTALNITSLSELTAVDIGNNSLSSLALPTSSTLATLYCDQNTLASLDVATLSVINYIDVTSSSITGNVTNMESLYGTLPTLTGNLYLGTGVSAVGDTNIATNKGWTIHYNGVTAEPPPPSGVGIVWHASGALTLPQITTSTTFFAYQWDGGTIYTMAHGSNRALTGSGSKLTFWSCTSLANNAKNGNLTAINFAGRNISAIDFRSLSSLTSINLTDCLSLADINLSNHTALVSFNAGNSDFSIAASATTSIDLTGCSNWTSGNINFYGHRLNNIQKVVLAGCSQIANPIVNTSGSGYSGTDWTQLDISGCSSLTTLVIEHSKVSILNLDDCPLLSVLNARDTPLTNVSFTNNLLLTNVNLESCMSLVSVNLAGRTTLTTFSVYGTSLATINLSGCSNWTSGSLGYYMYLDHIQSVDISGCSKIAVPFYYYNGAARPSFTYLNISGCSAVTTLDIRRGGLSASMLNQIYADLPVHAGAIDVSSNTGVTADDPTIATAKGWTVTGS